MTQPPLIGAQAPVVPVPRPRTVTRVAAIAPAAAPTPVVEAAPAPAEAPVERPAAASSAGGPLVQVGAFDSNAIAENEWQRLAGRNGSLFSGKARTVAAVRRGRRRPA